MPSECDNAPLTMTTGSRLTARTSRILRGWWLCASAVVAAALVTTAMTATTAHATTRVSGICPIGYLCLFASNGNLVLVPSGQSKDFPKGLPVVKLQNATTITYCLEVGSLGGRLFTAIPPATIEKVSESVFEVFPGPICPA